MWTFTNTRPRSCSPASACRCRAAGSPTAPSRRPTGRARSAARPGWSRRRSIPAGAARPAASSCAATTARSRPRPRSCSARRWSPSRPGARGKLVSRIYVEPAVKWQRELYLGFVLDRKTERVMVVASSAGGMEIEEIAHDKPETLIRVAVEPAVGMQALPGARDRLRAGPRGRADRAGGRRPSSAATAPSASSTPPWSRSTR